MLPILTIIGRPNVGKSTLFNDLTKTRAALVADIPGVTRDRQYGTGTFDDKSFIVIDTGGIEAENTSPLTELTHKQVEQAIDEATFILFLIDAKEGVTPTDEKIAAKLRNVSDKVIVLANKTDGEKDESSALEAYQLGFKKVFFISAKQRRGIKNFLTEILKDCTAETVQPKTNEITVTVIGRPNSGKSTLLNQMLGENRVMVSDIPGTTRDSIAVSFSYGKKNYLLIDTAGIRRRSRVHETLEKFSIVKTLEAINRAQVVCVLLDATEKVTEQDLKL
ncbi:MAG: ribosome biogenesis GTPase Der, partial [Gammaproteobacteria bacterium RIFOXYB2_FULL_38_6]